MAIEKMTGKELGEHFAEFVNVSIHDKEEFADTVTSEHRFLQQEMFNSMLKCVERWSDAFDSDNYDDRNRYAVKASKAMIQGMKDAGLY